ncbi:hypothetical protein Misp06_01049 [Microbulbifer sp. NBRC 101763]
MIFLKKKYIDLFLACYISIAKKSPHDEHSKVNAIYLMSFLLSLNVSCIPALMSILVEINVASIYSSWTAPAIVIAFTVMLFNFVCIRFLRNDIQESLRAASVELGDKNKVFVKYVAFSVLLPTALAIYFFLAQQSW